MKIYKNPDKNNDIYVMYLDALEMTLVKNGLLKLCAFEISNPNGFCEETVSRINEMHLQLYEVVKAVKEDLILKKY